MAGRLTRQKSRLAPSANFKSARRRRAKAFKEAIPSLGLKPRKAKKAKKLKKGKLARAERPGIGKQVLQGLKRDLGALGALFVVPKAKRQQIRRSRRASRAARLKK